MNALQFFPCASSAGSHDPVTETRQPEALARKMPEQGQQSPAADTSLVNRGTATLENKQTQPAPAFEPLMPQLPDPDLELEQARASMWQMRKQRVTVTPAMKLMSVVDSVGELLNGGGKPLNERAIDLFAAVKNLAGPPLYYAASMAVYSGVMALMASSFMAAIAGIGVTMPIVIPAALILGAGAAGAFVGLNLALKGVPLLPKDFNWFDALCRMALLRKISV